MFTTTLYSKSYFAEKHTLPLLYYFVINQTKQSLKQPPCYFRVMVVTVKLRINQCLLVPFK